MAILGMYQSIYCIMEYCCFVFAVLNVRHVYWESILNLNIFLHFINKQAKLALT